MSRTLPCFVGVDLGSTTTKAMILDAEGNVLGRGITNSRSNYDVACAVARNEAFVDARLQIVRRALHARADDGRTAGDRADDGGAAGGRADDAGASRGRVDEVLEVLDASFRRARHLAALGRLRGTLLREATAERLSHLAPRLEAAVAEIVDIMEEESVALFEPGVERPSDFFRDLASSSYMRLAEERQDPDRLPYDVLIGIFDKAILVVENDILEMPFRKHVTGFIDEALARAGLDGDGSGRGDPQGAGSRLAERLRAALDTELDERCTVGTGYGRARLPFPKEQIRSEILCHGLGAHSMFPATRTVLDIGGQDTKAIQVDEAGIVTKFQMNDRCAAGCGRYLGYIADEMNMGVHELGPLAMRAERRVKINSTCTVFAGAELRDRLNLGQSREDVLAGLHRAVMLRAMSLLARSGGIDDEFTFTGGVARNEAAVAALRELVAENYGARTINISPDSIYTGALGAALFALRVARASAEARGLRVMIDGNGR